MRLLDYHVDNYCLLDNNNHFFGRDSLEQFNKNLKQRPLNWPWRTKKIQYNLNSQKYRAPEWHNIDWNNSYVVFGCSDTFGVGINYTDTFVHHLSELLGYPTINLGVPGTSCMFQWTNTIIAIQSNVKPKGAIYLWPSIVRALTFTRNNSTNNYGPWHKQYANKYGMDNIEHCIGLTTRLIDSVNLMWSCPTYHFYRERDVCKEIKGIYFIETKYHSINDLARDYYQDEKFAHCGPKSNLDWANQMFSIIGQS